jgi:hypothetical protein
MQSMRGNKLVVWGRRIGCGALGCILLGALAGSCAAGQDQGQVAAEGTDGGNSGHDGAAARPDGGSPPPGYDGGGVATDGSTNWQTDAPPGPPGCGLPSAAFCDPFDTPSPGGNAGDLNDAWWSAARIATGNSQGQGMFNIWPSTTATACGTTVTGIVPPGDMFFCAGGATPSMHFNDSYNDDGGFTIHSYRIRQPFDFANRTGIIAFDVGGKAATPGGHGFWFNVFISEEPVPAAYQGGQATALFVKAGVGIEFQGALTCNYPSQTFGQQTLNGISQIFIEQNYAIVSQLGPGDPGFTGGDCFVTAEEVMNHIEIHISQSQIEVFATDAGKGSSLRSIGKLTNIALPLSRGYVNFAHTHYNAEKCTFTSTACTDCSTDQCATMPPWNTYHWDNIAFDGPVLPTPRAYEIPNNTNGDSSLCGTCGGGPASDPSQCCTFGLLEPDGGTTTTYSFPGPFANSGYMLGADGLPTDQQGIVSINGQPAAPVTLHGVDLTNAVDAALTLNAWGFTSPDTIEYRFNGGTWRVFDQPFPDKGNGSARAMLIPVSLTDLKQGDNTLEMMTDTGTGSVFGILIANAELTVNVP